MLPSAGRVLGQPLVRPVLALVEVYLRKTVPVGKGKWTQDTHLVWTPGSSRVSASA